MLYTGSGEFNPQVNVVFQYLSAGIIFICFILWSGSCSAPASDM